MAGNVLRPQGHKGGRAQYEPCSDHRPGRSARTTTASASQHWRTPRMLGLGLLCGSTIRFVGRGAFRRHTGRHGERRGRRKPWPWQMPGETPGR